MLFEANTSLHISKKAAAVYTPLVLLGPFIMLNPKPGPQQLKRLYTNDITLEEKGEQLQFK